MKNSDLTERFQHGELIFCGKLLKVYRDIVSLPDGHEEVREVMRHPGAAVVVPDLGGDRYVLVRQFRYALNRTTLEFPAGRLDEDEPPLKCAERELMEETGYRARHLDLLFTLHPAPGYTDELLHIYHARDLIPGPARPDPDELLLTQEFSLQELLGMFDTGEITDSKTVSAILYLKCCRNGKK